MIAAVVLGAVVLAGCDGPAQYAPYSVNVLLSSEGTGELHWRLPSSLSGVKAIDLAAALGFEDVADARGGPLRLANVPRSTMDVDISGLVAMLVADGAPIEQIFVSVCTPQHEGRVTGEGVTLTHFGSCALYDGGAQGADPSPHLTVHFEDRSHPAWPLAIGVAGLFVAGVVACEWRRRRRSSPWAAAAQSLVCFIAPFGCVVLAVRAALVDTDAYFDTGLDFDDGLRTGFGRTASAGFGAALLLLVIYTVRFWRMPARPSTSPVSDGSAEQVGLLRREGAGERAADADPASQLPGGA